MDCEDAHRHYTEPRGRLVLIAETHLTDESREKLRLMLSKVIENGEVTMVSGLDRASFLQAGRAGGAVFYNRDYITPEEAFGLMTWREVWLVAAGNVWQLAHKD